jgi:hypothetical protein
MQKPLRHFLDGPYDYVSTSSVRRQLSVVRLPTKLLCLPLLKSVADGELG